MESSNTEYGKFGQGGALKNITPKVTTVDEVYTELIQLRNKNRALEGRIKQLENQNFSIWKCLVRWAPLTPRPDGSTTPFASPRGC